MTRATLVGQKKLVDRLSIEANISGTPQANLAFECAEDFLEEIERTVKELESQYEAPCNIPSIKEKLRK